MAAKRNIPEAWKQQWSKFMFNFFDYLPTKYEANKREWAIRKMIWDFKDGKASVSVAELVAKKIREQFGAVCENGKKRNQIQGICRRSGTADRMLQRI